MSADHNPIDFIVQAARSRQAEHAGVLEAAAKLAGHLFDAVEAVCRELEERGAPGVGVVSRDRGGPLGALRFRWGHAHLAFVPHDEIALPPKSYNVRLKGRVGRVPLFHTDGPDETTGLVLRDYLVDAHGAWYYRGLGSAQHGEPITAETARAHAISLFFDLNANLLEVWQDAAQVRSFDEANAGRDIGFHA